MDQSQEAELSHAQGLLGRWSGTAIAVAVLGVGVLAAVLVYAWRAELDVRSLGAFGYPGIFLLSFLSSASVLVPLPGFLASAGGGAFWNPALVGLAGGLGAASGELLGFAAGRVGRTSIQSRLGTRWNGAESCLRRFGFWAVLALAIIPNPLFDAIGLAAGALAYPVGRFWLAAAVGNCLKYVAFAHLGGIVSWPVG